MKQTFTLLFVAVQATLLQDDVSPYTLTTDRLWATTAAVLALVGFIIGGLALARSTGRIGSSNGRKGAIVALVTGLIAVVMGGLVLITADGGPGTGNGIVGAIVALLLGLSAMAVGRLALGQSRRTN
jgi:MFS superfamily sulfate permease-like transporter